VFVDDLLHFVIEQLDVVVVVDWRYSVEVVQRRLQDVVLEGYGVDVAHVTVLVLRDSRWVARYVQAAGDQAMVTEACRLDGDS